MQEFLEWLSVIVIPPWKDDLALTVWCVFLAVVGVWIYLRVRRATLGKAIRALLDAGHTAPETAATAQELGVSQKVLDAPDRLMAAVRAEGEAPRYYLPEENRKKAECFQKAASGARWWVTALAICAAYLVMLLSYYFIPDLFEIFRTLSPF